MQITICKTHIVNQRLPRKLQSISRWMGILQYQLAGCLTKILNVRFSCDSVNVVVHFVEIY